MYSLKYMYNLFFWGNFSHDSLEGPFDKILRLIKIDD